MVQTSCPLCFSYVLSHLRGMSPGTEFYRVECQSCGHVTTGTVKRGKDWKPKADAQIYDRETPSVAAQVAVAEQNVSRVEVPAWASRAGLDEDYRDHARFYGEEAAASHCRALLREMRASA